MARRIAAMITRTPDYEFGGRRFESFRARQQINDLGLSGDFEQSLCPRCVRNLDGGWLALASHRMELRR